jgi:NADH-quinone oxidoreductase chain I
MLSGILKGFRVTLRSFFGPAITVSYPEERREVSRGYRGVPSLRRHPDGRERCVACALCVRICPAKCIEMTTGEGPDGKKFPFEYRLDAGRCLYCGLCAEVCPVEAVVLSTRYEFTVTGRGGAILDKATLLAIGEKNR